MNVLWLLLACIYYTHCVTEETETATKQLTSTDFDTNIKERSHFVKFFAPWCGHCQRLEPIWEDLSHKYNVPGSEVTIARVDCTNEVTICSAQKITGYPTLKFFNMDGSEPVQYLKRTRDLASLEQFIQLQLGKEAEAGKDELAETPEPARGMLQLTGKTFKKVTDSGSFFVKFYAPWCGHCQKLAPVWAKLAEMLADNRAVNIAQIDCTTSGDMCTEFGVRGYPTLLWIQDGKKTSEYQGDRSLEDLKTFVTKMIGIELKEGKPEEIEKDKGKSATVSVITADNFNKSVSKGYTFVKFHAPWCGYCKKLAPTWDKLAMKMASNPSLQISKVDCTTDVNNPLCSKQEVSGFPTLFLYHEGRKVTEYEGNRTLDAMVGFLKRNMKSDGKDEL